MTSYLLTAMDGAHERHFDVDDGPLQPDLLAVGLAYAHLRGEGLKAGHLFRAAEARWFVRIELP
jgi:hypothetical protein